MDDKFEETSDKMTHLNDLIKGIKIAMVTTVDPEGQLQSRPMATQDTEFDGQLYFFTHTRGDMTSEINADQHVSVTYADPSRQVYVAVTGEGVVVQDAEKMAELWKPSYSAWFPEGLADPGLALLWVTVSHVEYWESETSFVAQAFGFAKALLTGTTYQVTEHEKISLQ